MRDGCLYCPRLPTLRLGLFAYVYIIFVLGCHSSRSANAAGIRRRWYLVRPRFHRYSRMEEEADASHVQSAQVVAAREPRVPELRRRRSGSPEGPDDSLLQRPRHGYARLVEDSEATDGNNDNAEAGAAEPPESAKTFQSRVYKLMQTLHDVYPRMNSTSQMQRSLSVHRNEAGIPGQEAIASLQLPPGTTGQSGGLVSSLFAVDETMEAKSAFHGKAVSVKWQNSAVSVLVDGTENRYAPYVMCHDFTKRDAGLLLRREEEVLAAEVLVANECRVGALEDVKGRYHLSVLQDVLLLPGDQTFRVVSTFICANAVLLFDERRALLSSVLPLTDEDLSPMDSSTLERARLSLSFQIAGIVGSVASDGLVLPRFVSDAFLIKATGAVFMKSCPQPRRKSRLHRAPSLRRSSLFRGLSPSTLTHLFSSELNVLDLAAVLLNVWCSDSQCLLGYFSNAAQARARMTAALAARGDSIHPLVLDLIQNLVGDKLMAEGILKHHAFLEIGRRLGV